MNINNSGNDCADFSFGNYKIFESTLSYCQDKGISFGERSIGLVKNSIISESTNGFIAKDNSFLELHDSRGDKILKYCLAAYNKKPEFEGAKIIKNNFKCVKQNIAEKIKEYTDSKSIIQWTDMK